MALEKAEDFAAPAAKGLVLPLTPGEGTADARTVARMERTLPDNPPLKTSVTAIAKQLREEKDEWESPADKRRMPQEAVKPAFLEEKRMTAAEKGTVTHRVLGQIDYALAREGNFAAALDGLQRQGVLSDEERAALQIPWLKAFFSSDLGRRALDAREVHREWSFNLRGEKGNMIQGVIDLCFLEEGGWVLADYKTDAADGEELLGRYSLQLRWYAAALAAITGVPVKETLIFGLRSGRAYPVPEA